MSLQAGFKEGLNKAKQTQKKLDVPGLHHARFEEAAVVSTDYGSYIELRFKIKIKGEEDYNYTLSNKIRDKDGDQDKNNSQLIKINKLAYAMLPKMPVTLEAEIDDKILNTVIADVDNLVEETELEKLAKNINKFFNDKSNKFVNELLVLTKRDKMVMEKTGQIRVNTMFVFNEDWVCNVAHKDKLKFKPEVHDLTKKSLMTIKEHNDMLGVSVGVEDKSQTETPHNIQEEDDTDVF